MRIRIASLSVLLICFLFGACGGGGGGGSDPGVTLGTDSCNVLGLKIFHGAECTPAAQSPVVDFIVFTVGGGASLCSGSLITDRRILTAGHCFPGLGRDVESVQVLIGGERVEIDGFVIDPGYREDDELLAIFNDDAVITLSAPVGITPLPILVSKGAAAGDVIDIFGYGLDQNGNVGELRSGQMALTTVTATHLFSEFGSKGSNTCQGDSGGPALETLNGESAIVGLTSTGSARAECASGDVSLFTNVQNSSVLGFIQSAAPGVRIL